MEQNIFTTIEPLSKTNIHMEKKTTTPVVAGLIISMILIVLAIVGYITQMDQQKWYPWISYCVFGFGILFICTNYAKQMNSNVTFGNLFAYGFKTSAVVACIMIIFFVVFLALFPDIKDKAIEMARKKMQSDPRITEDQIESSLAFVKKSFLLIGIIASTFFYIIVGAIAALVGAAVSRKEPETPFQNQPLQ